MINNMEGISTGSGETRHPEYQYLGIMNRILDHGWYKPANDNGDLRRSYVGAGMAMEFDLSNNTFPLITTKNTPFRLIGEEIRWMVSGSSNIRPLVEKNVHIWDEWGFQRYNKAARQISEGAIGEQFVKNMLTVSEIEEDLWPLAVEALDTEVTQDQYIEMIKSDDVFAGIWGELGPVYGVQWRRWKASDGRRIDQLATMIERLKSTRGRTRNENIVDSWNPEFTYEMALPGMSMQLVPCHYSYQFLVDGQGKLITYLTLRSNDMFLGAPFNIAGYALLTKMVAQVAGMDPGKLVYTIADAHVYQNHETQVREQLKRVPREFPKLVLNANVTSIDSFDMRDFVLTGYNPHPRIKGDVTLVGGYN